MATTKLEIDDGNITAVETSDVVVPLRDPVSVEEAERIQDQVTALVETFDLGAIAGEQESAEEPDEPAEEHPWNESEIQGFLRDTLRKDYREKQVLFLRILAEEEDLPKEEMEDRFREEGIEVARHTMDGLLSSMTRRSRDFGQKESLWESYWADEKRHYRIRRDEYAEVIKNFFEDQE